MYLERSIDRELLDWKEAPERKPLLVRGAKQVGKSSSIRKLGESFSCIPNLRSALPTAEACLHT
ncbi:MAG: hypothetical protein KAR19_16525 [Bacteroidales bacterium]|nr:hypothetical protein [Bacteroidales bacterium]